MKEHQFVVLNWFGFYTVYLLDCIINWRPKQRTKIVKKAVIKAKQSGCEHIPITLGSMLKMEMQPQSGPGLDNQMNKANRVSMIFTK